MSEPTPEPAEHHWPTYALLTFSLAGIFAAGAILSFAFMHAGRPYAQVYAICCTVTAVVVFAATVVCLKLDQVLKRQLAITQILGTVRLLARAIEQIEQVVAGIRTTNLATLQRTGELRVYADALDVRIGEVDTRLTELTQSLMAHRERTTVVVSETREEYRQTLAAAVDRIQRDLTDAATALRTEMRQGMVAALDPSTVQATVQTAVTKEFDVFLLDLAEHRPDVVDFETVRVLRQVQQRRGE